MLSLFRRPPRAPRPASALRGFTLESLEDRAVMSAAGLVDWAPEVGVSAALIGGFDGASATESYPITLNGSGGGGLTLAAQGRTIFVSITGNDGNTGLTQEQSLRTINKAIATAAAGDTIWVAAGVYDESLAINKSGIRLSAAQFGTVIVKSATGRCVTQYGKANVTIENFIFDGQWGASDIIKLKGRNDNFVFRNNEVRNGTRDGLDIDDGNNLLIEQSRFHHLLWWDAVTQERRDAHGIVVTHTTNLTIRDTEIHHVSGDAFQAIFGRWDGVTIDRCNFWNGPLESAMAGFTAGVNPGENAVDTKKTVKLNTGHLTIKNSEFHGWRGVFMANPAALNIKHNVDVVIDSCELYDNGIAFRLRGPDGDSSRGGARVTVINCVTHDNGVSVRFEDGIRDLHLVNNTFGRNETTFFARGGNPPAAGFVVRNNLFVGVIPTKWVKETSNVSVNESVFVDALHGNYHLKSTASAAINKGVATTGLVQAWYSAGGNVALDHDGVARTTGGAADIGAFEFV